MCEICFFFLYFHFAILLSIFCFNKTKTNMFLQWRERKKPPTKWMQWQRIALWNTSQRKHLKAKKNDRKTHYHINLFIHNNISLLHFIFKIFCVPHFFFSLCVSNLGLHEFNENGKMLEMLVVKIVYVNAFIRLHRFCLSHLLIFLFSASFFRFFFLCTHAFINL